MTDRSMSRGDSMAELGSFVLDIPYDTGFFRAGVSRINDSIRTYVWAILGSQSQARSSILGSGKAFDAQKQFIANVEDAFNSDVDLPSSIHRYQRTLQYARSKVDFVIGHGLYMLPINMEIEVGVVNGYNNLIQIATEDMQLGFDASVNESERAIFSEITREVSEPDAKDFETPSVTPSKPVKQPNPVVTPSRLAERPNPETTETSKVPLTHDERKLSLILGVAAVVFLASFFR